MKTIKEVLGCLSMAALAIVLAAPVSAQTITLKASVPFDFVVRGRTMPAGDYVVSIVENLGVLEVLNAAGGIKPTFTITSAASGPLDNTGAFFTFRRYGGDYFLAAIWDGAVSGGRSIPISRTEQEKSKSASIAKPDVVVVLARR